MAILSGALLPYTIRMARKSLTLVSVGPHTTRSPSAWKKTVAVIIVQHGARTQTVGLRACEAVRRQQRARVVLRAVDAVRVAGDGVDAGRAVERQGQRQQELGVAATPALPPHRHRGLAARQDHAGLLKRRAVHRDRAREGR